MPTSVMSSDDPPELTSGSGMPFVGIMLSTTLMFMNACTAIIVVSPSATNDTERVGRMQRDPQAAPRNDAEAEQHQHRAHQPELLRDDRVDEVGVRFRQIEQLLHALHQAAAADAAGADGNERLDDLKAVAERVGPRIQEASSGGGTDRDSR